MQTKSPNNERSQQNETICNNMGKKEGLTPIFVNAKQLAQLTGLSHRTIQHYHKQGKIKAYRPFGRVLLFKVSEVVDLITKAEPIEYKSNLPNLRKG